MVGDPSREDAAADAHPGRLRRVVAGRVAALVDDHGVALDAAVRRVVADVEKAVRGDAHAEVHDGLGGAVEFALPLGVERSTGDPRVDADRAPGATRTRERISFCMIILGLRRCDLSGGLV